MPRLEGIPISPGHASGLAVVYDREIGRRIEVPRRSIARQEVDAEVLRLDAALNQSNRELSDLENCIADAPELTDSATLMSAHSMMATEIAALVRRHVGSELVNVEQALLSVINEFVKRLQGLPSEYLRGREQDVRDVGQRLMRLLARCPLNVREPLPPDSILVASELLPSEAVELSRSGVIAIVSEHGGIHSHTAIVARTLGIPMVTGIPDVISQIKSASTLLVDGLSGHLIVDPTQDEVADFASTALKYQLKQIELGTEERLPCVTRDGIEFSLLGNVGLPDEANGIADHAMAGVGLFRTEFLFLESHERPQFEEQREIYSRMASTLDDQQFVVRTFDLGGDKLPPFLLSESAQGHTSLHLRGLRFSLAEHSLLETQLQALTDVAQTSVIRILFPMVIGSDDFSQAVAAVDRIVIDSGFTRRPQIGAMIETPAALYALDEILELADFVAIGTNDLSQYMLAVDRELAEISDECSSMHPAVLRAIEQIIFAAAQWERPVCVCGEEAGDPDFACILMGLGIRELSMSPSRAASVRHALRHIKCCEASEMANAALQCRTPKQVRELVQRFRTDIVPQMTS